MQKAGLSCMIATIAIFCSNPAAAGPITIDDFTTNGGVAGEDGLFHGISQDLGNGVTRTLFGFGMQWDDDEEYGSRMRSNGGQLLLSADNFGDTPTGTGFQISYDFATPLDLSGHSLVFDLFPAGPNAGVNGTWNLEIEYEDAEGEVSYFNRTLDGLNFSDPFSWDISTDPQVSSELSALRLTFGTHLAVGDFDDDGAYLRGWSALGNDVANASIYADPTAVPEPATMALLLPTLAGGLVYRARRAAAARKNSLNA